MNHSYLINIPTTIYNTAANPDLVDDLRIEVKTSLAKAFGGYTETEGMGGYVAESGELIEERVYVIEACYEVENDELIESLATRVKETLHQECVMVRKDWEVRLI